MFALRVGSFEFSPSIIPTVAAIFAIALTVSLGRWQVNRAGEKEALQRQYESMQTEPLITLTGREGLDAQHLQFRHLIVEGEFDANRQIFLDNQVANERVGYHVLTPMKLAGDAHYVLVNRGWIARGAEYPSPPKMSVPAGRMRIEGHGGLPVKRFLELSADTVQGAVWQNVTFARYEQAMKLDLLPIILVQTVDNAAGLTAVKQRPDFGIAKHQGYAFQWFALSAAILATYIFVNTQRVKK